MLSSLSDVSLTKTPEQAAKVLIPIYSDEAVQLFPSLPSTNSYLDGSSSPSSLLLTPSSSPKEVGINESISSSPPSNLFSSSLLSAPSVNLKSPTSPTQQVAQQIDNFSSDSLPPSLTSLSFTPVSPVSNSNTSSVPSFVLPNSPSSSNGSQSVQFLQSRNLSCKDLHSSELVSSEMMSVMKPEGMMINLSSSPVDSHAISKPVGYSVEGYPFKEEPSLGVVKSDVEVPLSSVEKSQNLLDDVHGHLKEEVCCKYFLNLFLLLSEVCI
jgi:hypothetical protein